MYSPYKDEISVAWYRSHAFIIKLLQYRWLAQVSAAGTLNRLIAYPSGIRAERWPIGIV